MSCGGMCGLVYSGGGKKKTRKVCRYKSTKKNRNTLKRYKRGESIGFTQTASLKAKGLLPRTSKNFYGKRIVSEKYCSS